MDNIARRDPKNLNNKMSLKEVQALTPSFNWKAYLGAVKAPPSSPYYLVSSPPVSFAAWNRSFNSIPWTIGKCICAGT